LTCNIATVPLERSNYAGFVARATKLNMFLYGKYSDGNNAEKIISFDPNGTYSSSFGSSNG